MKKIVRSSSLLVVVDCFLTLYGYTTTTVEEIFKDYSRQKQMAKDLSSHYCQDCKGPYCLKIGRIIFCSNQGAKNGDSVLKLKQGSNLSIKTTCICCNLEKTARNIILRATLTPPP